MRDMGYMGVVGVSFLSLAVAVAHFPWLRMVRHDGGLDTDRVEMSAMRQWTRFKPWPALLLGGLPESRWEGPFRGVTGYKALS
jgi:hypothetical protein